MQLPVPQIPNAPSVDPSEELLQVAIEANPRDQVASRVPAEAHYTGRVHNKGRKTRLRISNGGGP